MEISNSCIYLGDKALSSYIYVKNYQQINLDKKELEKDFLMCSNGLPWWLRW